MSTTLNRYVTKDYEGFRQLMIDYIPSICPEWTDHSSSDFGIALIEILSLGLDVLSFYQDKAISESNLSTAVRRDSVIKLCRMLTYELTEIRPAVYKLKFTKEADFAGSVYIPRGYQVGMLGQYEESGVFETDADLILAEGVTEGYVTCTHGFSVKGEAYTVLLGSPTPNYRIRLNYADIITDALALTVLYQGVEYDWLNVDDFIESTSIDRHYTYEITSDGYTELIFGDGVAGVNIPTNCQVRVSYRVGGGTVSNVGLGTINTLIGDAIQGLASVTNTEQIQLGVNVESVASAKQNAPKHFKTNHRAVTVEDYLYFLKRHPDVLHATITETFTENIDMYVLARDLVTPTRAEVITSITSYMDKYRLANAKHVFKQINLTNFKLRVLFDVLPNYIKADVTPVVTSTLSTKFHAQQMTVGRKLSIWEVYKAVSAVEGVDEDSIVVEYSTVVTGSPVWTSTPFNVPAQSVAHLVDVVTA